MTVWPADWAVQLVWLLLPQGVRLRLAQKITAAQSIAAVRVPTNDVEIYSFSTATDRRYRNGLAMASAEAQRRLQSAKGGGDGGLPAYGMVATCLNERDTIGDFLDSVARQSHPPRQVVICDGGSRDGTVREIESWKQARAAQQPEFELLVLEKSGASIAAGRNAAAREAEADFLLFADAGTILDKHWAERMCFPLLIRPETEVVMGWYKPAAKTALAAGLSNFLVPKLSAVDPASFLPSARSLAVRKRLFAAVGGFPEHLSKAGEDSLFDYYLKTAAVNLAFVPDAVVYWQIPNGLRRMVATVAGYARGDAEGGTLFWSYYLRVCTVLGKAVIEGLFALLCALLAAASGIGPLRPAAIVLAAIALGRLLLLVLRYQPFAAGEEQRGNALSRFGGLCLMLPAQALGFVSGLMSRRAAERRRVLAAPRGHLVLLLPRPHRFDFNSAMTEEILAFLDDGWYLVNIYAAAADDDVTRPIFEHPRIENYMRAGFDAEVWWNKHRALVTDTGREFRVIDRVGDALSSDLACKLAGLAGRV